MTSDPTKVSLQLTAYIISAADGVLLLGAVELPALRVTTRNVDGIADALRTEVSRLTGRLPEDIQVEVPY